MRRTPAASHRRRGGDDLDSEEYRGLYRQLLYSVSLDPPLVLVCVDNDEALSPPLPEQSIRHQYPLQNDSNTVRRSLRNGRKFADLTVVSGITGSTIFPDHRVAGLRLHDRW